MCLWASRFDLWDSTLALPLSVIFYLRTSSALVTTRTEASPSLRRALFTSWHGRPPFTGPPMAPNARCGLGRSNPTPGGPAKAKCHIVLQKVPKITKLRRGHDRGPFYLAKKEIFVATSMCLIQKWRTVLSERVYRGGVRV